MYSYKSIEFVVSILLSSISIVGASEFPDLCKTIGSNISGVTIILFLQNQSIAFSESFSKVVSSASFSFEIDKKVLSSSKLYISEFSNVVSRSFRKMLNKEGHRMEPCSTPEISDYSMRTVPTTTVLSSACFQFSV